MHRTIQVGINNKATRCLRIFFRNSQLEATSLLEKKEFVEPKIPLRIKRSPTDLLKAMSTTISRDRTAPHYKYHDDPYLYPFSNIEKRNYALSKESGKKAAKWIRDTHGTLFNHQPDDPVIKEYLPKIVYDENSDVSESDLQRCINNIQVSDAINVYGLCQSKNIDISADTRQALLELISFYNCEEALDLDWVEEKRNEKISFSSHKQKSWKDGSLAEELFEKLKENGVKPYCAIIKGMCLYGYNERAWQLYQEALAKEFIPDTETFNALITIAPALNEVSSLRWTNIEEILHKMVELKVPPNLGTMNSCLGALTSNRGWVKSRALSLQVFAEFRKLNIEPSLATYYYLLKIYYTSISATNNMLPSILNEIENKSFTLRDFKDTLFFYNAMEICLRDLNSYECAKRVHNFLMNKENFNLLGGKMQESFYFRFYFILSLRSLPLNEFMVIYDDLVPHFYTPDYEVLTEILQTLIFNDDIKLLPRVWSDIILFEYSKNASLTDLALKVMKEHHLEAVDEALATQLVNIVWYMWTKFLNNNNDDKFKGRKIEWSSVMLGDSLSILARCKDIKKALEVYRTLNEKPSLIIGVIPVDPLKHLFNGVAEKKMYTEAMAVLTYCKEEEYPDVFDMAKQLAKDPELPKNIMNKLINMYGESVAK